MKQLTLKGSFLVPVKGMSLPMFLGSLMLHGKESRERSRFIQILESKVKEIEQERFVFLDKYTKKSKDGKPLFFDKMRKETSNPAEGLEYVVENIKEYNKEFEEYLSEEYIIDVSPATSATIYTVKDLILNTTKEFQGEDADRYNEWCEAFEGIKEAEEK